MTTRVMGMWMVALLAIATGCGGDSSVALTFPRTPTGTPLPTATEPPQGTATPRPTATPPPATATSVARTATATATAPPATRTATAAPTATTTPRPTTAAPSATATASATPPPATATAPPSATATVPPPATATAPPTGTATELPSATAIPSATATSQPTNTAATSDTPTADISATPTATPTPTTGSGAICGNRVLEPGETCESCPADCVIGPCNNPGMPMQAFVIDLVPPLGFEPTTATVLLAYNSTILEIPGTGTAPSVRGRVVAPPPVPQAFTPNDLNYAVRVLVSRNVPLGTLFTATFDRCGGAPAPLLTDVACQVESCAAGGVGVPDCTCTVRLP